MAAVLVGVAWLVQAFWRGHAYAKAFAAVARGDSETRVVQLFGRPHRTTGRPENIAWGTEDSIHRNGGRPGVLVFSSHEYRWRGMGHRLQREQQCRLEVQLPITMTAEPNKRMQRNR